MPRHHGIVRLMALAVLATCCLTGPWGCQAEKAGTSGGRQATAPAAVATSPPSAGTGGLAAAPTVSGQELLARVKPFLDCAYAAYVSAQAGQRQYRPEAATAACAACDTLLEPFREFVFERTGNADYVNELSGVVREHAAGVMQQASAAAK